MEIIIGAAVLLLVLIFIYYYYTMNIAKTARLNGYWMATEEFLTEGGLDFACAHIKDDIFIWLVECGGKTTVQSYKITHVNDDNYEFRMISGGGSPVFGDTVKVEVDDGIITLKDDILLFEGEKMKKEN